MSPTPVVIVGAGAAGCTQALLLARYGIASTVVEQRTDPRLHPAAHVINARTLEIWNQASPALVQALDAITPAIDTVNVIRWCTGIGGEALGEIDLLSQPDRLAEVRSHSSFLISHIGQHLLMPALWDAVDNEPLVDFRRGWRARYVDGQLLLQGPGEKAAAPSEARVVIAADGANSVLREGAGIAMTGPVLANMGSVFFHAPDLFPAGQCRPLLSWIYHPQLSGVLIAHADDDYVLMTPYLHPAQQIAHDSAAFWRDRLPAVLGSDDFTIRSTGTWTMTSQMAERFRSGRLILIGDAAHRFPHTGGFGLNSGVQDAHNLAWKLSAILQYGAADSLLDTYEAERRPVIARFAEQSVHNHFKLDDVTAPLGITNRSLHKATELAAKLPAGRLPDRMVAAIADGLTRLQTSRTRALLRTSAKSRRLREHIATAIPDQLEHFVASRLEFGYTYDGVLIGADDARRLDPRGADDGNDDDVTRYQPSTAPGARLPHIVLCDADSVPRSIHELIAPVGLTLFTADTASWTAFLDRAAFTVPVTVVALAPADPMDPTLALFDADVGAVVARPDGHVVWRSSAGPQDAASLVDLITGAWSSVYPGPARTPLRSTMCS
ncbi:MAG: FAD-dependent monooxygenase [Actinomycetota bacterium]